MANTNSLYQLFGGYSPNERPKRIRNAKQPIGKIQMDPDLLTADLQATLDQDIKDFNKKVIEPLNPTTYVKKLFVDDPLRELIVTSGPQGKILYDATAAVRDIELGQEEQSRGVQLKVSINPYDWYKDPEKELKKLGNEVRTSLANWADLSSHLEMTELWNPLLDGKSNISSIIDKAYNTQDQPLQLIFSDNEPLRNIGPGGKPVKVDPFRMDVIESRRKRVVEKGLLPTDVTPKDGILISSVDSPAKVAASFKDFFDKSKNVGIRNTAYRNHVNESLDTVSYLLKDCVNREIITNPEELAVTQDFIIRAELTKHANALYGKKDATLEKAFFDKNGNFIDKTGTVIDVGSSRVSIGLNGISEELAKLKFSSGADITKAQDKLDEILEKIAESKKLVKDDFEKALSHYSANNITRREFFLEQFKPLVGDYVKNGNSDGGLVGALSEAETVLTNLKSNLGTPNVGKIFKDCKITLDSLKNSHAREAAIYFGDLDILNRGMGEDLAAGEIAKLLSSNPNVHIVGRNISNVMKEANSINGTESLIDLAQALDKKGLLGVTADVLWNTARTRLDGYAPNVALRGFLQNMQYFGLKIDMEDGKGYGWVNNLIKSSKIFDNNIKIDFTVDKVKRVITFKGGTQNDGIKFGLKFLEVIGSEHSFIGRHLISGNIIGGEIKYSFNYADLIDLINEDISPKLQRKLELLYGKGSKDYNDILEGAKAFRKMLESFKDQLGLTFINGKLVNSEANIKTLTGFLGALKAMAGNKFFASMLTRYVGFLQKASSLLSRLQGKVLFGLFKKYGKFLAPLAYVKRLVAKKFQQWMISRAATQAAIKAAAQRIMAKLMANAAFKSAIHALMQALGVAADALTLGASALLTKIVAFVVTEIVVKVMDKLQGVIKSIKEGNIDEFLEDGARRYLRTGIYATSCFVLCIMLPILMTFEVFMAAITPVDTSVMAWGDGITGPGGGPGDTFICPNCADGAVPGCCTYTKGRGCFVWADNFVGGTAEAALAILHNSETVLTTGFGNYLTKLCAEGEISVSWGGSSVACGYAASRDHIKFGTGDCWRYIPENQGLFNYLFAHETGHVFAARRSSIRTSIARAITWDGGTLPTYDGNCSSHNTLSEDVAETIGNWVTYHRTCKNLPLREAFWRIYSAHKNVAISSELFGGGE